jgi:hypothetical protein
MKKYKPEVSTEEGDTPSSLPPEDLERVLLHSEITTLLSSASESPNIAAFLSFDDFWRRKFLYDFDDLVQFVGTDLPDWIIPHDIEAPPSRAHLPWKRYYYAIRFLMRQLYRYMIRRRVHHQAVRALEDEYQFKSARVTPGDTHSILVVDIDDEEYDCSIWMFLSDFWLLDEQYDEKPFGKLELGIRPNCIRECMLTELIWYSKAGNPYFMLHLFGHDVMTLCSWIVSRAPVTKDSKWFDPIRSTPNFDGTIFSLGLAMLNHRGWGRFVLYSDPHELQPGDVSGWSRLVELGRNGQRNENGVSVIGNKNE